MSPVHLDGPDQPVFSRHLLEVQMLDASRGRRLVTVHNTHLQSHFVPFTEDPGGRSVAMTRPRWRCPGPFSPGQVENSG
jgi:hypothetical protein